MGFIGLGLMGSAMAANLQRRVRLIVWNRTRAACEPLGAAGAVIADSPATVFDGAPLVFVMLSGESAIDEVLDGVAPVLLRGRVIVLMSTVRPSYSADLARRIIAAGGGYVEAPVSGSRLPAEHGTLVCMLSGPPDLLDLVQPLVHAMCSTVYRCGAVPAALRMKLAVNTFLITLVTGLAEAFHFARCNGVDAALLQEVLDAGPMASAVSRAKGTGLVNGDWTPHAAISDVLKNCRLIQQQAQGTGAATPLVDVCTDLYATTESMGHGALDMIAVIRALQEHTPGGSPPRNQMNPRT